MGRKTFESLPKALPNRKNIVLTRNKNYKAKNAIVAHDLKKAIEFTDKWDQAAFDPEYKTDSLESFEPLIKKFFEAPNFV